MSRGPAGLGLRKVSSEIARSGSEVLVRKTQKKGKKADSGPRLYRSGLIWLWKRSILTA